MQMQDNSPAIEDKFDVTGLLIDYLNNWKYFAISLLICLGVAFCHIRTIVPTYQISAAVYLNDDNTTKTSAVSVTSDNPMIEMKQQIDETEIEILKSRNSLLKIVDTLNLSYQYAMKGNWRDIPVYKTNPIIASMDSTDIKTLGNTLVLNVEKSKRSDKLNIEIQYGSDYKATAEMSKLPGRVKTPAGDVTLSPNGDYYADMDGTEIIKIYRPSAVAGQLAGSLTVKYPENSWTLTIINFTFTTPLPDMGTDILRMIIYFYNRQIIEDKNRSAIQTEEFIQARLKDIQNELKDVEETLRDYRERHNIVNQDAQVAMNLSQKQTTETGITELRRQERMVSDMMTEVSSLEITASRLELQHLPVGIVDNAVVNSSVDNFNRLVDRYNNQRTAMTEENENITRLINTLREQKTQILRTLEAARRQLSEQRQGMANLEMRSASQLSVQPTVEKGLQEIFRDQSVKANIYTFLLQKREEIALQKTLATPTAQFIDSPSVSGQVAPIPSRIYMMGVLLGLLIPAVLIFFRRLLFPKFKDKEDLQRITKVNIIGEICQAHNKTGDIVVGENISSSTAELFRLLRNNINFAQTNGEKKVILVTSSISGEGKTFVAMNLAMTYALTGKRVCVVGLDIRRPVLAHKLGISNREGVTSYLSDQISDINSIIFPTDLNPNLFAVPAGPIPPNPNELLLSPRMNELFNQLRQEFDYIIIDSAPIGLVSDSLLLVPHSDIQLYVTRASYSSGRGLHTLHDTINSGQLPHPYIVLNGVNMSSRTYQYRHYGGYYGYSHHGYGYDGTRSRKKKKKKRDSE